MISSYISARNHLECGLRRTSGLLAGRQKESPRDANLRGLGRHRCLLRTLNCLQLKTINPGPLFTCLGAVPGCISERNATS